MKPIAALLLMTLPIVAQDYKIAIIGMVVSPRGSRADRRETRRGIYIHKIAIG